MPFLTFFAVFGDVSMVPAHPILSTEAMRRGCLSTSRSWLYYSMSDGKRCNSENEKVSPFLHEVRIVKNNFTTGAYRRFLHTSWSGKIRADALMVCKASSSCCRLGNEKAATWFRTSILSWVCMILILHGISLRQVRICSSSYTAGRCGRLWSWIIYSSI